MVAMPHAATSPFAIPRTRGVIPTAAGLLVAGALFVIYPALRPFSDEVSLEGARAFASTQWVWAHTAAMIGFLVLSLSLFGVAVRLRGTRGEAAARWGAILGAVGIGLTLPYYGAEVFGLHAVGQAVVERGDVSLMSITDSIRWEAGIWFILVGLAVLGVGMALTAAAIWRSGRLARWSGIPLAVAFALFIPQFGTPQPVRVAHGVLIAVGCVLVARALLREAYMGEDAAGAPGTARR